MGLFKSKKQKEMDATIADNDAKVGDLKVGDVEFANSITPKDSYIFNSDYFRIDRSYCSILTFTHKNGANDRFPPFWGVMRMPDFGSTFKGVSITILDQVSKMDDGWVVDKQTKASKAASKTASARNRTGSQQANIESNRQLRDLADIGNDLANGASYMHVHMRMLVKAPSLEALDSAIQKVNEHYMANLSSVRVHPHAGNQAAEITGLTLPNAFKRGRGFHFTSPELAGMYNLVTHGFEDRDGEYIGRMTGDVNTAGVLFNVNNYDKRVVIGNSYRYKGRLVKNGTAQARVSDMWASKISQSAMLNGGRVVHIILNDADMNDFGPELADITHSIDMASGELNMFEMFGDRKDNSRIFAQHTAKMGLIMRLLVKSHETNIDLGVLSGVFNEVLTKFYVDARMWVNNAAENDDKIRIVGIPHEDYPLLQAFVMYLSTEYKVAVSSGDTAKADAITSLQYAFRGVLDNNGDLFNKLTTPDIDNAKSGTRVIYKFEGLDTYDTDGSIAMAQLVNVLSYAVSNLGPKDTVIIQGADKISKNPLVRDFIKGRLEEFQSRNGRVVYSYDNLTKMINDNDFCGYIQADYTIMGGGTNSDLQKYQATLGQNLPQGLGHLLLTKQPETCFIRREFTNVVFRQDLRLDIRST